MKPLPFYSLAKRGVKFTQAYAASPLCSTTRSSILTGVYPARSGITSPTHLIGGDWQDMSVHPWCKTARQRRGRQSEFSNIHDRNVKILFA